MPRNDEPVTLADRAAKAAFDAIDHTLNAGGAKARHIFIIIDGEGCPVGEPNASVGARGYEDDSDLLAELLGHAEELGREMGIGVNVITPTAQGQG